MGFSAASSTPLIHKAAIKANLTNNQNGHISIKKASNQKNKGTLFPWNFKVEKAKVPLAFSLEASWLRYAYTDYLMADLSDANSKNKQDGHISVRKPQIKKVMALCFLEILKLKRQKRLYYFYLRLPDWDMALLLIFWSHIWEIGHWIIRRAISQQRGL